MFDNATVSAVAAIADRLNVEPAALLAVAEVESAGKAFARVNGRNEPLIRFEGHYFWKRLSGSTRKAAERAGLASPKAGAIPNPTKQEDRWKLLNRAAELDAQAAFESCSWGVGQVMGSHWKSLGFSSVTEMVNLCRRDVAGQVDLMARFIEKNGLVRALRAKNWPAFAKGYNGSGYAKNAYDKKMATAYAKWSRRKIEAEPEIIPVPLPAFVATKTIIARVQSQLHDKGYTEVGSRRADGSFDGVKGNMTDAAILLAKKENNFLPLDAEITEDFVAALPGFPNRKLATERANATPAEVAAKVPEARANWWGQAMNAVAGFFSTIAAALFGVFQYFGVAKETVDQLKEYAADVPGEVWLGLIGVIALGMALLHRYGLNSSTEAFKKAERR